MKNSLFYLGFFLCISVSAFAERIVLKNPNPSKISHLKIVRQFELNGSQYVAVDAPTRLTVAATDAESVFADLPVGLVENADPTSAAPAGWHLTEMRYADLPQDRALGANVVVAVLDTGVDVNHQALKDNIWVNADEIAGNGIDDDNNGYVDDLNGYDFVGAGDANPDDREAHGTHCSGIIAAKRNAQGTAMGVAPQAKIMAVKILTNQPTFVTDVVEGIKYAVDNGASILSNSWRVYKTWNYHDEAGKQLVKEALRYAEARNVIFVAAAGNETMNNDTVLEGIANEIIPAGLTGHPNLVVVASGDQNRTRSSFTNFGISSVMIAAPGSNIMSTIPGDQWTSMSGTSMATPLIAGVLARGLSTGMDARTAIEHLKSTSERPAPWTGKIQSGLVNIVEFLK